MPNIDLAQYKEPITGSNLSANNLADLINSHKIVILHFVRHLGCIYCQHSVDQLFELKQRNPHFPPIIFVHQSSLETGDKFFAHHFPEALHISDPQYNLYHYFGIKKLKGFNFFNPKMILKGILLTFKGYLNTYKGGDVTMLSGTFLFHNGKLLWEHRAKYAGDEPQWERINIK